MMFIVEILAVHITNEMSTVSTVGCTMKNIVFSFFIPFFRQARRSSSNLRLLCAVNDAKIQYLYFLAILL